MGLDSDNGHGLHSRKRGHGKSVHVGQEGTPKLMEEPCTCNDNCESPCPSHSEADRLRDSLHSVLDAWESLKEWLWTRGGRSPNVEYVVTPQEVLDEIIGLEYSHGISVPPGMKWSPPERGNG